MSPTLATFDFERSLPRRRTHPDPDPGLTKTHAMASFKGNLAMWNRVNKLEAEVKRIKKEKCVLHGQIDKIVISKIHLMRENVKLDTEIKYHKDNFPKLLFDLTTKLSEDTTEITRLNAMVDERNQFQDLILQERDDIKKRYDDLHNAISASLGRFPDPVPDPELSDDDA